MKFQQQDVVTKGAAAAAAHDLPLELANQDVTFLSSGEKSSPNLQGKQASMVVEGRQISEFSVKIF